MLNRMRMFVTVSLAVVILGSSAFAAPVMIGKIVLNESSYEKFGVLYFPFRFNIRAPLMFVLCENGVSPAGGCVNNVVSDVICVSNNQVGEGVAAMISDLENGLSLGNLPPDFPCPAGVAPKFLAETGKGQVLSGRGIPTILPTGGPGPLIKVTATSDLDAVTTVTSDVLTISTQ
jgi:hypothetical protein